MPRDADRRGTWLNDHHANGGDEEKGADKLIDVLHCSLLRAIAGCCGYVTQSTTLRDPRHATESRGMPSMKVTPSKPASAAWSGTSPVRMVIAMPSRLSRCSIWRSPYVSAQPGSSVPWTSTRYVAAWSRLMELWFSSLIGHRTESMANCRLKAGLPANHIGSRLLGKLGCTKCKHKWTQSIPWPPRVQICVFSPTLWTVADHQ